MKYNSFYLFFILILCSFNSKENEVSEVYPPYQVIRTSSKKIEAKSGLALRTYGVNYGLPKDYPYKNEIANFTASYSLTNQQCNLEKARELIIFVAKSLLQEINSNDAVKAGLEVCPMKHHSLDLAIHFEDANRVHLGQGVAKVYLQNGRIKYEGYNISEYTGRYPAKGKYHQIHEETYGDALILEMTAKNNAR